MDLEKAKKEEFKNEINRRREILAQQAKDEIRIEFESFGDKVGILTAIKTFKRIYPKYARKLIDDNYFKLGPLNELKLNIEKNDAFDLYIVEMLKSVISKEQMKEICINSNISCFFDELRKYATEEEIIDFTASVDFVNEKFSSKDINVVNNLKKVNMFLIETYTKKLKFDLDNSLLSKEEFWNKLSYYITLLIREVEKDNVKYEILSTDEIITLVKPIINSTNENVVENSVKK